jgi:thymidylate synthase
MVKANIMQQYLDLVDSILTKGVKKENRTGVDAITIPGAMFEHDMSKGFPLLTTKSVPFRLVSSELEFFIKGITDKEWLRSRNNHIWDEWCNPEKVKYGHDLETKQKMKEERDLGCVYGWQWRNFGAEYVGCNTTPIGYRVDQLHNLVEKLKKDPSDRRMIVTAWNPLDIQKMALPPCHYTFQVTVIGKKLNLLWNQRSVDVMLGLPFNIASYGLLLHLLAKESNLEEGNLVGFLADTHIYVNHIEGAKEQMARTPFVLPKIVTTGNNSIFDWEYTQSSIENYQHHPKISFEIAV